MRNESDIFCLKELKEGDTNGTQMFSVNGQCHLAKLRRRGNLHVESPSFEYGSSPLTDNNHPEPDLMDIAEEVEEKVDSPVPSPKKKSPNLVKVGNGDNPKVSESVMPRNPLTGAGVEMDTPKKSKKGPGNYSKWMW